MTTNTKNPRLAFITNKKNVSKPNLIVIVPHTPMYDFLSFLCWYSFAKNLEFMNAALVFIGRPSNSFRTWAHKFSFKTFFVKKFNNLEDVKKKLAHHFDDSYVICMYNIFLIKEDDNIFKNNFINANIIFQKDNTAEVLNFEVPNCTHDELVPIVKFNFANEDLIASKIINNDTAENPFLAEKKAPEESVNEVRLELLYRRCRELYRTLMEGDYEKQV